MKSQSNIRSEKEIIGDIQNVYDSLSPENLSCDGELSRAETNRRYGNLKGELRRLFAELGREVTEEQAYRVK